MSFFSFTSCLMDAVVTTWLCRLWRESTANNRTESGACEKTTASSHLGASFHTKSVRVPGLSPRQWNSVFDCLQGCYYTL
ncbi:hypothetical protein B0T25DRAFT_552228 [Lasiosphaeria hispida]|uniref:Secreted protein n=1 Tax=Lasiosphaeria hispida TaxID=260671 RepID=A0AAJ0HBH1_9PEZI|nr:hypothetical protein B0T25DRAFT_552228 [Lasiosphaeria hispida]